MPPLAGAWTGGQSRPPPWKPHGPFKSNAIFHACPRFVALKDNLETSTGEYLTSRRHFQYSDRTKLVRLGSTSPPGLLIRASPKHRALSDTTSSTQHRHEHGHARQLSRVLINFSGLRVEGEEGVRQLCHPQTRPHKQRPPSPPIQGVRGPPSARPLHGASPPRVCDTHIRSHPPSLTHPWRLLALFPLDTHRQPIMSTSSGQPESWIASFCSLLGHEYFAEVSEEFIEDDFNLTGLQSQVPMYKEALEVRPTPLSC